MLHEERIKEMKGLILRSRNLAGDLNSLADLLKLIVEDIDMQGKEMLDVALGEIKRAYELMDRTKISFEEMRKFLDTFVVSQR